MSDSFKGSNKNSENRQNQEVEEVQIEFDITFQASLLKLALKDEYFCGQLVKYLKDEDLKEYNVFAVSEMNYIFQIMCDSILEFKIRPTESQIRQSILEFAEDERDPYFTTLDMIINSDIHNESYFKKHLKDFVQRVKLAKGFKKSGKLWKSGPSSTGETAQYLQTVLDGIIRIDFEQEDLLHLHSFAGLAAKENDKSQKIPTGLVKLDEDLRGGFPREVLVTVLGSSNAGKSLFCSSLACSALRAGFKVLHINLEGTRDETIYKYIANLADIPFWKLEEQKLSEMEKLRVDKVIKQYDSNIRVRNMLNFGVAIEDVIAYCREAHKDFPFDMLVVDYGQLLKVKSSADKFERQTEVYRGLDSISKEFSCVVISPAQATREGIRKQNDYGKFKGNMNKGEEKIPVLRSEDLADCIEIARVSAVIITLNRTEEEEKRGWVRVYLEKQRRGKKGITYGVKARYDCSNLVINDYYDANSLVHKSATADDDLKDNAVTGLAKTVDDKKEIFAKKHTLEKIAKEATNPDELDYNDMVLEYDKLISEKKCLDEKIDKEKDIVLTQDIGAELFKNRERRKEIEEKAPALLAKFMPQGNAELYAATKQSLRDLLSSGAEVKPEDLLKTQLVLKQLGLVFEE